MQLSEMMKMKVSNTIHATYNTIT